jgi:hypothetical protein
VWMSIGLPSPGAVSLAMPDRVGQDWCPAARGLGVRR